MKLIAMLLLCSRLLPSLTQESSQEIDCNDEDLFKAVDTALKKYNSRNQSGNQFVLYRVTEVTRTVSELCLTLRSFEICAVTWSPAFPPPPPIPQHTHPNSRQRTDKQRWKHSTVWPRSEGQGTD